MNAQLYNVIVSMVWKVLLCTSFSNQKPVSIMLAKLTFINLHIYIFMEKTSYQETCLPVGIHLFVDNDR